MRTPQVSVLLCCHNEADFVAEACRSLDRQTLAPEAFEVLLLDDGSTDQTSEAVADFTRRPPFRYVRNPETQGLVPTCNRGLDLAEGRYVIRLDADDLFEPGILEELRRPLEENQTDLAICDRWEGSPDDPRKRRVHVDPQNIYSFIAIGSMMRRDLLQEIGGYRNLFWEEYDLYIRYLTRSRRPAVRIAKPLLIYHRREGSMTSDPRKREAGWEQLRKVWPESTLRLFGTPPS